MSPPRPPARRITQVSRPVYLVMVLLFCLTWSSAFPMAKLAVGTGPPALFLGIRYTIAAALLFGWVAWRGELGDPMPWGKLIILGVLNQAGYQGLAWAGMRTTSAGLTTIIVSLNPILISVIAAPLLGEALGARKIVGLLLGFGGAAFVVRNRIALGEDPWGIVLVVGSLASTVAGTLLFKKFTLPISLAAAVGGQQLAAGLLLLALGFATEDPRSFDWGAAIVPMLWFIFVVSIGAMLLWFLLLRLGSASSASALHFIMPPLGLAMSWLILGERIDAFDLIAVIPVALGIWLVTRAPQRVSAPIQSR